jgi:hypothetical protein
MFGMPIKTPITIALGVMVAVWLATTAMAAPTHSGDESLSRLANTTGAAHIVLCKPGPAMG